MAKFLEHVIAALAWVAVIGAGAWFGVPMIYAHLQQAEQALQTVKVQSAALAADSASASAAQASCANEIKASMRAQQAIQRAATIQPPQVGKPRGLIGADQIEQIIQ